MTLMTNLEISLTSISNQIGQIEEKKKKKKKPHGGGGVGDQKLQALELGLKLKIQLLAKFCPPSVCHKIRWYQ